MMEPIDFEEYKRQYFKKKAARRSKWKKRFFSLILPVLSTLLILGVIGGAVGIGLSNYFAEQNFYTEGYQLEECTYYEDDDENIHVTVTFENDARDPVTFTIAKGALGGDGNIISSVSAVLDEDENLVFTVNYSDEELEPLTFSFPLNQGEDGRLVETIDVAYDEETHQTTLIFNYTDGDPDTVTLPDLYSGDYGFSITNIEAGLTDENGNLPIHIYYTNNTTGESDQIILISKGEDGATIGDFSVRMEGDTYYIDIYLADNETGLPDFTLSFGYVEETTSWFYGSGNPNNNSYSGSGKEGDFYFDTANDIIYCKETLEGASSPTWNVVFDVHQGEGGFSPPDYCFVTYDLNGGVWANAGVSTTMMSSVKYGDYAPTSFSGLGDPYIKGKTFKGWYSYPDYGNPNAGKLDRLTQVVHDITVYAWFE